MGTQGRIQSIAVILTADCNLSCRYCYQNAKKVRSMAWATLRASLDLVLDSRPAEVKVLFLGGEPLLEFPLIRRAVEYAERKRSADKLVHYLMITNGTLLSERIVAFLEAHSFALQISFDGAAQDVRGVGTFVRLDHLLDRLRKKREEFFKRNVTVCTTVTPATIARLPESIDYFLGKGIAEITIGASITAEPSWRIDRIDELDALFGRVSRSSLRHWRKTGKIPVSVFHDPYANPPRAPRNRPMCALIHGNILAVDVDGQTVGCPVLADSYQKFAPGGLHDRWAAMRMGSIHHPRFPGRHAAFLEAAMRTGMFGHKENKYSSYRQCRECRYIDSCSVCPGSIAHVPGNKDPNRISDFCCAFNLVSLKYRERFSIQCEPIHLLRGPKGVAEDMERWRKMAEVARSRG